MNVTQSDITETRKQLVVSFTAEELAAEDKKVVAQFASQANLKGFRKGKAPVDLLRRRYQKEIKEELRRAIAGKAYDEALKNSEMDVHSIVEFQPGDLTPGKPGEVNLTIDIRLPFDLPEYTGIATTVPPTEVAEAEVDEAIENVRRERADFKPVERPAEKGDYVKVSYKGMIGEQPIAEILPDPNMAVWGTQENTWEEAGAEGERRFGVPAVIDNLEGMSAEETKTVEMDFDDQHPVEALRGEHATYEMTVHEVRERVLPELTEEFLGSLQMKSLEEFRERVTQELTQRKQQQRRDAQLRQILDHLTAGQEWALPESAIEAETQNIIRQVMQQNMQRGVTEETFEQHKEELYDNARQNAHGRVRQEFILEKIAEKEKIDAEEQDFQRAIMSEAMQTRQAPDKIVKELRADRSRVDALRRRLRISKTLDFLVDKAVVTEMTAEPAPEA